MDLIDKIIRYEQDDMSHEEIIQMFQELMNTGLIFGLQGSYQRTATRLMNAGLITIPQGE